MFNNYILGMMVTIAMKNQKLRNFIDSYFTINEGAEPYNTTTNQLNALVDQYNVMMAGRGGKDETPPPPVQ